MQKEDYKWFLENYDVLFEKYGCAYLAIKNSSVLGAYATYADGVNATNRTEEPGTFIIQFCNGQKEAYTNYISSMNFV